MLKYSTTGRHPEGFRIFFLAHPAASPCTASGRERCALTEHCLLAAVSTGEPGPLPFRCTSFSSGRRSARRSLLAGLNPQSVSPAPPVSQLPLSALRQNVSSSWQNPPLSWV